MMTESTTLVGAILGQGRYQVTQKLGEGGMALVFLAQDRNVGVDVVVKVPKPIILADPEFARRFKHEIRSMVQLAHPHVVKIKDVGEHQGLPYYVMELLTGGSLEGRIAAKPGGQRRIMAPDTLAGWLEKVAAALDFVHSQGVVHRDIKPANILFDQHGNAFVSDFGIAKAVSGDTAMKKMTVMTQAGMVLGTGPYLAPEVALGEKYDGRADQYALAVTVYEVLGGRVPFSGTSLQSIIMQQTTGKVPPLHDLVPAVPKALSRALEKALHQDPNNRYLDCATFAGAVLAAVENQPTTAFKPAAAPMPGPQSTCPACKRSIRLPANPEGKTIECPACGAKYAVAKKPGQIAAGETSVSIGPDVRTRPARRPKASPASNKTLLYVAGAIGAGMTVLSCLGLFLFLGAWMFGVVMKNPPQVAKADPAPPPPVVDALPEPKIDPPVIVNPVQPPQPKPPIQPPVDINPQVPAKLPQYLGGGPFLIQSITRVTDRANDWDGYGYNDFESVLSGWADKGQYLAFNYQLTANTDYLFVAAGDNDARVVDLEIFDLGDINKKRVALDQSDHPEAIVRFRPQFSRAYQLKLTLFNSRNNLPCMCSLVVLKRNGWKIPFKNLDDATASLAKLVTDLNKNNQGKKAYEFRRAPNQWAVFGGALKPGSDLDVTGLNLTGDHVVVGACDKFSNRLDLSLSLNGKVIATNPGPTNEPWIFQNNCLGPGHGLRLVNNATVAPGNSFVMMAVLDVK